MATRNPRRSRPLRTTPGPERRAETHDRLGARCPLAASNLDSRRLGPVAPELRRLRHVQPRRCHRRSRGQPQALENRSRRLRWRDGGKHDEPTLTARTLQDLGVPNPLHQIRPVVVPGPESRSRLPCPRTLRATGADASRARRRRGEHDLGSPPRRRRQDPVVDDLVHPRPRHEHGEPRDQFLGRRGPTCRRRCPNRRNGAPPRSRGRGSRPHPWSTGRRPPSAGRRTRRGPSVPASPARTPRIRSASNRICAGQPHRVSSSRFRRCYPEPMVKCGQYRLSAGQSDLLTRPLPGRPMPPR